MGRSFCGCRCCPPPVCSSRSICAAAAHSARFAIGRAAAVSSAASVGPAHAASVKGMFGHQLISSKKTSLASAPRAYLRFVLSCRGARVASPLAAAPPSICGAASGSLSFGARAWLRGCRAAPPFRVWVLHGLPLCLRCRSGWARGNAQIWTLPLSLIVALRVVPLSRVAISCADGGCDRRP